MAKAKTIRNKFVWAMIFVLIAQSVFFVCTIIFGGALDTINNTAYDSFLDTTTLRKSSIEAKLKSDSDLLTRYNGNIISHLQAVADSSGTSLSQLMQSDAGQLQMFDSVTTDLLTLTKYDNVTGAYVVLCNSAIESIDNTIERDIPITLPALYVREGTGEVSGDNITQVLIGDNQILNKYGLGRYTYWTSSLSIDKIDNLNFITEPFKLSINNPNVPTTGLGYWSNPYTVNFSKSQVISYTVPLRDSSNTTYGVLGIELTLDELINALPYYELNNNGNGSYALAFNNDHSNTYKKIVTSGNTLDKITKYSNDIIFSDDAIYKNLHTISPSVPLLTSYYASVDKLNIYNNSNYAHDEWILTGALEGTHLLTFANGIKMKILFSFALSTFACLAFVLIAPSIITKPISVFISEVKQIRPDNPITPKPTNISEINELGMSIELLTKDLTDFSCKASKIIDMAGISIGAFEYNPNSNVVFCTDIMFNILNIDREDNEHFTTRKIFEDKVSVFLKTVEPNINQVYKFTNANSGTSKWIHFKTLDNNGKILGIVRDVTNETVAQHKRTHARDHDTLTSLLNRIAFRKIVDARADVKRVPVAAFVYINLDDVSSINQKYSTVMGDNYIKTAAQVLNRFTKQKCVVGRMTGDEFLIYIEGRSKQEVEDIITSVVENLHAAKLGTPKGLVNIEATFGVAWFPEHSQNVDVLIQYAQFAMRASKAKHKNGLREFKPSEYADATKALRTKEGFEKVLTENLVRYAFQPIINSKTGDIYGYEALMRPVAKSQMSPSDIINFATMHNKLSMVERITWFSAFDDYSKQIDSLSSKKLFINSIPNQLLSPEDFALLESKYGDYLDNIVLEIIENEQTDINIVSTKKALVDKWGCMLALDDYGSGYANDNTLLSLKPDIIKLDIDLVTGIEDDFDRQTLVNNIIYYAHERGIKVLAEGIETRVQLEKLIELDVDLLQGFYLATPNFIVEDMISETIRSEIREIQTELNK